MNYYDIVPEINKVFYRETNEDWVIVERVLLDHQFILITGGKGWFSIEGKRHPVRKGMLCYFYPTLVYSAETNAMDPLKFYYVHFHMANLDYKEGEWRATPFEDVLPIHIVQVVDDYSAYLAMFVKLYESVNSYTQDYFMLGRIVLEQMIVTFIQDVKKQVLNFSKHLKVEKTIDLMQKQVDRKIKLEEIAEQLEISPAYLSRLFKEETGYNFIDFFNRIKMDAAKLFIADGNMKLKEIAGLVGISDPFYFSRLFKKVVGMSPTEYYYRTASRNKE